MGQMLDAWAAVLDRSFEQLAGASADARTFDRIVVAEVADVWDNHLRVRRSCLRRSSEPA